MLNWALGLPDPMPGIFNWHVGPNGVSIGDYKGEKACTDYDGCFYWSLHRGEWLDQSPLHDLIPSDVQVRFRRAPTWKETVAAWKDCAVSPNPTPEVGKKEQPTASSDVPDTPNLRVNAATAAAGIALDFKACVDYHLGGLWWP